jgi:hypothetical protein
MMNTIVECRCCGEKCEYEHSVSRVQRNRPCGCSANRCFVSGKCVRHCLVDHPSCGQGDDPAALSFRNTFAYSFTRTSG